MKRIGLTALAAVLGLSALIVMAQSHPLEYQQAQEEPSSAAAPPVRLVEVVNFPDPQNVIGTVEVSNLSNAVTVENLPIDSSGNVPVSIGGSGLAVVEQFLTLYQADADCVESGQYFKWFDIPEGGPWRRLVASKAGSGIPNVNWTGPEFPLPAAGGCVTTATLAQVRLNECHEPGYCYVPVGSQLRLNWVTEDPLYIYLRWEK